MRPLALNLTPRGHLSFYLKGGGGGDVFMYSIQGPQHPIEDKIDVDALQRKK